MGNKVFILAEDGFRDEELRVVPHRGAGAVRTLPQSIPQALNDLIGRIIELELESGAGTWCRHRLERTCLILSEPADPAGNSAARLFKERHITLGVDGRGGAVRQHHIDVLEQQR